MTGLRSLRTPLFSLVLVLTSLALGGIVGCEKEVPGTINLYKLGLEENDRLFTDKWNAELPNPGTEYFLAIVNLATCLECKKSAIWVSRVWSPGERPRKLVYLDVIHTPFEIEATRQFIFERQVVPEGHESRHKPEPMHGIHYACDLECLERFSDMIGRTPDLPRYYFVGAEGLIHWEGGYLTAYSPVFKAIRQGRYDVAASLRTEPAPE